MTDPGLDSLSDDLPGDWRIVKHIFEVQSGAFQTEVCKIKVESDRYNVVLEGSWPWIMQRIHSYMLSAKG